MNATTDRRARTKSNPNPPARQAPPDGRALRLTDRRSRASKTTDDPYRDWQGAYDQDLKRGRRSA